MTQPGRLTYVAVDQSDSCHKKYKRLYEVSSKRIESAGTETIARLKEIANGEEAVKLLDFMNVNTSLFERNREKTVSVTIDKILEMMNGTDKDMNCRWEEPKIILDNFMKKNKSSKWEIFKCYKVQSCREWLWELRLSARTVVQSWLWDCLMLQSISIK